VYSDKDERLLVDIEKLIKQDITRGELQGFTPAARPHGGGERTSERRPRREEGAPPRAFERAPRTGGLGPAPRREKVDPWFLKPYEPSANARNDSAAPAPASPSKPKQKIAALLGGLPKA
jgi:hypothetical protein